MRVALALIIFSATLISLNALSCLNRENKPVTWSMLIKYPGNVTNDHPRYAYLDNTLGPKFKVIDGKNADSQGEPLPNTIDAINAINNGDKNLLVYSNIDPNGTVLPGGAHAKGILAFDSKTQTGVYIIHTILPYPQVSKDGQINSSFYADFTFQYGQYAYCISIDAPTLNQIVSNLHPMKPIAYYASGIFKDFNSQSFHASNDGKSVQQIHLSNGDLPWFLTKHQDAPLELYEDFVVPFFNNISLAANSWGRPYQPPTCTKDYQVVNVNEITIGNDKWELWWDNSKWAISTNKHGPKYACLCDGDRADDQHTRGGGCFCNNNIALWTALTGIVTKVDKCNAMGFLGQF